MHPLHEYIAKQLSERIKARTVVVWYDPNSEFVSFVAELRGAPKAAGSVAAVSVAGVSAQLAEYEGSFLELRALLEPHVSGDAPDNVVIYMPGSKRDRKGSMLMEVEKAGDCYEPQLKRFARNVLRERYTDGVIDDMLAPERVTYEDLVHAASNTTSAEPPSILKSIFHDVSGNDALLAAWLASDQRDTEIETKQALRELTKLVRSRLGLELPEDVGLSKLRSITLRYVLGGEFRSELHGPPPPSLDAVPPLRTKDDEAAVRELARRLRTTYPGVYPAMADVVEAALGLAKAKVPAESLGGIDTFRFEEGVVLSHCGEMLAAGRFDEALSLITKGEQSFWLSRDVGRKAHWEAVRRMAELGNVATAVRSGLPKVGSDPGAWIEAYTSKGGWHRMDQAQRRLEAWVANLEDEPAERPLAVVRRLYEDVCNAMAEGFTKALGNAKWVTSGSLHQTQVFAEVVSERPRPVAYFLVDAMRYEMGLELSERLPKGAEVSVRNAVGMLPSITPIGMAALQPGASASFSVIEQGGKLGARIEDAFLPDLPARRKFASARVPNLVDSTLDEILSLQPSKLLKKIQGAQVVVVRSQEIDHAGEAGFTFQARQVMDTVIDNLARAIRKLAAAGVEYSVVSADHGHMFFPTDREESMRTDAPGGDQIELHRRCWIGRGGTTPPGCVRVSASALGYSSDLEFVFPVGCGVFKAGGDLAFHHGGPSLQELIVPVVSVRLKVREPERAGSPLTATNIPDAVTNRIFSVSIQLGQNLALFANPMLVRPLLVSSGKQVGAVGMAIDAELDRDTGCVRLQPGKPATVAFLLSDESAPSVRIVVQDPATDAELYRSNVDIPVRLGV